MIHHLISIWRVSKIIRFFKNLWRSIKWIIRFVLEEEKDQFHQIIKCEVKGMKHADIKQLEKREFNSTIDIIEQENLITNMLNRLNIEADIIIERQKVEPRSLEHAIFKYIESLKLKNLRKRTWFTYEHLIELKTILERFPNNHSLIKKALKISAATFKRLKSEWENLGIGEQSNKREERSKRDLNVLQKTFVKKFVNPPTVPLTLNEI